MDSGDWVRTVIAAPDSDFWLWVGVAAVLALAAFVFTFRWLSRARLIEDIPTSRIRSAAQGYVELEGIGELLPGEPILSPLTQTPCAWYRCKVEQRTTLGDKRRWRTVRTYLSDGLFVLRDGSGECVVDPEGAAVIPGDKRVWYGDAALPLREPLHAGRWTALAAGGDYRYTEERLLPGAPLYALGWFRTVGGANEAFDTRTEVRELLATWKRDPATLDAFDRNADGRIDQDEWEEAREVAVREVRLRQRKRALQPGIHTLSKPQGGETFLLSARSQAQMSGRWRWLAIVALATFFGAVGAAAWAIAVRLGAQ